MAFGDVLKTKINLLSNADKREFWKILKEIAYQEILNVYPHEVDSDVAVELYYLILKNNIEKIPNYFKDKLLSNNQERFRVINRNIWTSNAFHSGGLANMEHIYAKKVINPNRKGSKIIYQGDGYHVSE